LKSPGTVNTSRAPTSASRRARCRPSVASRGADAAASEEPGTERRVHGGAGPAAREWKVRAIGRRKVGCLPLRLAWGVASRMGWMSGDLEWCGMVE